MEIHNWSECTALNGTPVSRTPLLQKIQETLRKKGGKGISAKGQGRVLWDDLFWVWQGRWTYGLTAVVDASTGSKLST